MSGRGRQPERETQAKGEMGACLEGNKPKIMRRGSKQKVEFEVDVAVGG